MSAPTYFTGRSAVVTGAASGIGREIAVQLAARGADVLVTDVKAAPLEEVVATIVANGGRARARQVDVTDVASLQAAIDDVVATHGRLDLMFNNAGVAVFGDYESLSVEDGDLVLDVNLRGVVHGSTLAYAQMVEQGSGHIVNTASAAGFVPVPLQAHYCATKHGVIGLSKTLRLEAEERNVAVTVYCPAWVESGMFEDHTFRGTMEGADPRGLVPIPPLRTDVAVRRLLDGVARRKAYVITPFYGRLGWWFERLSPAASHQLHRRTLSTMRRRLGKARV